MNITIQYPPHPKTGKCEPLKKQIDFHSDAHKFRCYIGGVGSGKTLAGCLEALKVSFMYPNNVGMIGAPTYPMLRDVTQKTFFDVCPRELIQEYKKAEEKVVLINGSEILFRSFDDPNKAKGINLGWFYIDEGTDISEELFLQLTYRLRLNRVPKHYGWITTNPNGKDWVYRRFVDNPTQDYGYTHATTLDNTALDDSFIRSALEGQSEDYIRRFIYAEFVSFEGQVVKDFNRLRDVVPAFPVDSIETWQWHRFESIDVGSVHPTAILHAIEDKEGTLYIVSEHEEQYMDAQKIASVVKSKRFSRNGVYKKPMYTVIDTSAGRIDQTSGTSIREQLSELGVHTDSANKDVQGSIMKLNSLFKLGKLKVFDTCTQLITQLENVRWEKPRMVNGMMIPRESIVKKDDDLFDALRYLVMSRPDLYTYQEPKVHPTKEQILRNEMKRINYTQERKEEITDQFFLS